MSLPIVSDGSTMEAPLKTSKHRFTIETAKEYGSKGGKVLSKRKLIQISFTHRKWCNESCPIFPCVWAKVSKEKFAGKCAVKEQPPDVQQSVTDFYLNGLEGLQSQALMLLAGIAQDLKDGQITASQRKGLLRDIALVKETFYGKKLTLDGKIQQENVLTIDAVRNALINAVQGNAEISAVPPSAVSTVTDAPDVSEKREDDFAGHPG